MRSTSALTLPLLALFAAACGFRGGNYPSLAPRPAETPRVIEAATPPVLSAEERAGLQADLARERKAIAETAADIAREGRALSQALAAGGVSQSGSAAWSNAQMALSRFDLARSPLDSADARLVPLQRLVGDLPENDADRQAVDALAAEIARESAAAEKLAGNAARKLG